MSILQVQEQVSGDTTLITLPPDDPPVGVAAERVDPYTLHIVQTLFGTRGLHMLAKILRQASAKQLALPDLLQHAGSVDVAVINVQSLRILAKQVGISYDTLEKYVVVFCQLRLLSKKRHRRQITLHFPLCRCQLAEPEILDSLNYRPKVASFVRQVKRRFVLLRQNGGAVSSPTVVQNQVHLPSLMIEDIRRIFQQENVDSELESRLLPHIENALHYRCSHSESRLLYKTGDFQNNDLKAAEALRTKESPFPANIVDSETRVPESQSLLLHKTGDFQKGPAPRKSLPQTKRGDSDHDQLTTKSPLSAIKGDFSFTLASQKGRLLGQNDHPEHEKGDSQPYVVEDMATPNVNVILRKKIESLNDNVGAVADYLLHLFSEPTSKRGYYYNLYNKQQCQDPEAWLAATIETIIAIQRKRSDVINNPGGYFYKRCIALHREPIPAETAQLSQLYGSFSYQQLLDAVQKAPVAKPNTQQPGHISHPRTTAGEITRQIPLPARDLPGMPRAHIVTLMEQIRTSPQTDRMRYKAFQRRDTTYILLVQDWLGQQRWMRSLADWQASVVSVQRSIWQDMKNSTSGNYHKQKGMD